jgi:hypothetical protein
MELAQDSQLVAVDRVRARGAVLDPADIERGAFKVDLIPTKVVCAAAYFAILKYRGSGGGWSLRVGIK